MYTDFFVWHNGAMANDPDEIIIPPLKAIRDDLQHIKHDVSDLKFRVGQVEETLVHHTQRSDRIDERLARIEARLELVEA